MKDRNMTSTKTGGGSGVNVVSIEFPRSGASRPGRQRPIIRSSHCPPADLKEMERRKMEKERGVSASESKSSMRRSPTHTSRKKGEEGENRFAAPLTSKERIQQSAVRWRFQLLRAAMSSQGEPEKVDARRAPAAAPPASFSLRPGSAQRSTGRSEVLARPDGGALPLSKPPEKARDGLQNPDGLHEPALPGSATQKAVQEECRNKEFQRASAAANKRGTSATTTKPLSPPGITAACNSSKTARKLLAAWDNIWSDEVTRNWMQHAATSRPSHSHILLAVDGLEAQDTEGGDTSTAAAGSRNGPFLTAKSIARPCGYTVSSRPLSPSDDLRQTPVEEPYYQEVAPRQPPTTTTTNRRRPATASRVRRDSSGFLRVSRPPSVATFSDTTSATIRWYGADKHFKNEEDTAGELNVKVDIVNEEKREKNIDTDKNQGRRIPQRPTSAPSSRNRNVNQQQQKLGPSLYVEQEVDIKDDEAAVERAGIKSAAGRAKHEEMKAYIREYLLNSGTESDGIRGSTARLSPRIGEDCVGSLPTAIGDLGGATRARRPQSAKVRIPVGTESGDGQTQKGSQAADQLLAPTSTSTPNGKKVRPSTATVRRVDAFGLGNNDINNMHKESDGIIREYLHTESPSNSKVKSAWMFLEGLSVSPNGNNHSQAQEVRYSRKVVSTPSPRCAVPNVGGTHQQNQQPYPIRISAVNKKNNNNNNSCSNSPEKTEGGGRGGDRDTTSNISSSVTPATATRSAVTACSCGDPKLVREGDGGPAETSHSRSPNREGGPFAHAGSNTPQNVTTCVNTPADNNKNIPLNVTDIRFGHARKERQFRFLVAASSGPQNARNVPLVSTQ